MGQAGANRAETSSERSRRERRMRKLAKVNLELQPLIDDRQFTDKRAVLSRHRQKYADLLGMSLDQASAVLPTS